MIDLQSPLANLNLDGNQLKQDDLIVQVDSIIQEKASHFIHKLNGQFNTMHLELIRNFMQQETDIRSQLEQVVKKNSKRKAELKKLRAENRELR